MIQLGSNLTLDDSTYHKLKAFCFGQTKFETQQGPALPTTISWSPNATCFITVNELFNVTNTFLLVMNLFMSNY